MIQVNCFALFVSTAVSSTVTAIGMNIQARRRAAKQRRMQHAGLRLPWRRKPGIKDARPRCSMAAEYLYCSGLHCQIPRRSLLPKTCKQAPLHRRAHSGHAACKEVIERGLAAEHAMDMREAVKCFEVSCIRKGLCYVYTRQQTKLLRLVVRLVPG